MGESPVTVNADAMEYLRRLVWNIGKQIELKAQAIARTRGDSVFNTRDIDQAIIDLDLLPLAL